MRCTCSLQMESLTGHNFNYAHVRVQTENLVTKIEAKRSGEQPKPAP